jgi:hypothetical protein
MKQFKSAGQAQRFLCAHDQINNLFRLRRDHFTAAEHRASRTEKFQIWAEICSVGCNRIFIPITADAIQLTRRNKLTVPTMPTLRAPQSLANANLLDCEREMQSDPATQVSRVHNFG